MHTLLLPPSPSLPIPAAFLWAVEGINVLECICVRFRVDTLMLWQAGVGMAVMGVTVSKVSACPPRALDNARSKLARAGHPFTDSLFSLQWVLLAASSSASRLDHLGAST